MGPLEHDARSSMLQLSNAFNYIQEADTPLRVLAGINILDVLFKVYPNLPQAIVYEEEVQYNLSFVIRVLLKNFNPSKDQTIEWSSCQYNINEDCLRALEQLAPCFKISHIDLVLPKITEAAETSGGLFGQRSGALDVLTALLKRLGELDPPETYLERVCIGALVTISKPQFLCGRAWYTLSALSRLLTLGDRFLARSTVNLQLGYKSLVDLAVLSNKAVLVDFQNFEESCIEHIRNRDQTKLELTLSGFRTVCIAVGGFHARSACEDLVLHLDSLPTKDWLTAGISDFILRCAPFFAPKTAFRVWKGLSKSSDIDFSILLFRAIAPRLSDQAAEKLFKKCLKRLQPLGKGSKNALGEIEALGKRKLDRTPFAQAATKALVSAISIIAEGDRNDYVTPTLQQACQTLGTMSATDCRTLQKMLETLLSIITHSSEKIQPFKDPASMAMAQIMEEASAPQRPLLSSFLFELDVVERDVDYFQPVWTAYISTLKNENEINSAYNAFVRGASLSKRMECNDFWDLASILSQRLHGERRDAWFTSFLEAAKEHDGISPFARKDSLFWAPCLTTMVQMSQGQQRTDVLSFLKSIGIQARECGMLVQQANAAVAANDSSCFGNLWEQAEAALGNSESSESQAIEAIEVICVLYEAILTLSEDDLLEKFSVGVNEGVL